MTTQILTKLGKAKSCKREKWYD